MQKALVWVPLQYTNLYSFPLLLVVIIDPKSIYKKLGVYSTKPPNFNKIIRKQYLN